MPTLSMFYGIIVYMFSEKGERHRKPHIHCKYGEHEAVYALDGELLEGGMPPSKRKLIEAWMEIHKDELAANWELLSNGEQHFRISPLQ